MGLKEYQRKRDFSTTPEPAGGERATGKRERIFVVQLHHASRRHYDFRLELDGVLKSWAVPKGPSFDPSIKRLAVEVEDHPLSYTDFAGEIPKGHYGAGHVDVFDTGTWTPLGSPRNGLRDGDLKFELHGDILRGSWVLVRTRMQGSKQQWLLIKHKDEFAGKAQADDFVDTKTDRPRQAAAAQKTARRLKSRALKTGNTGVAPKSARLPVTYAPGKAEKPAGLRGESISNDAFAPELCKLRPTAPIGDDWLHEVKWDGYRLLATVVRGKPRLWSRNAIEWTDRLPDLVEAIRSLGLKSGQLDGEMVVLSNGRDDFNALQARLSDGGADNEDELVYVLFDLLHKDGESWRDVALVERKEALAMLLEQNAHPQLRFSEHQLGSGAEVFKQATAAGLEGIVSKRADSRYRGGRGGDWIKVKSRPSDEFVVIGYTEPKGSRSGIGSLLLAQQRDGELAYVGRVGTGLDDALLRSLRKRLGTVTLGSAPVNTDRLPAKDRKSAIWTAPKLVIEVFNQGYGGNGLLRQASFKTLREDKTVAGLQKSNSESASTSLPSSKAKAKASKSPIANASSASAKRRRASSTKDSACVTDVTITHPDRVVFKELGKTKADVATYYAQVADQLLPGIRDRALSLVRCPGGIGKACFFQKHAADALGDHVRNIPIREKNGTANYLGVEDLTGLMELVQMNALEFHPWGGLATSPELADRIVFDLDPHPSVSWKRVVAGARELRKRLDSIGLESFVRTSGGKGLHVVVPLDPGAKWEAAKRFAQAVARTLAELHPKEFVAVAGESNRKGKIFIDWLRNGRGATSVASYSLRARPSAGVAMPLDWKQLSRVKSGDHYTIDTAITAIKRRKQDPWRSLDSLRQALPDLD
ncbi:MAG: DNA ligase D [Dokdonella sp.]